MRRWSDKTRHFAYLYLAERDGELCAHCHRTPSQLEHPLEIDEVNGVRTDHAPSNLQFLCKSCNVSKENRQRPSRRNGTPSNPETPPVPTTPWWPAPSTPESRVSVGSHDPEITRVIKSAVDYQTGSPEMRANDLMEVRFRQWLLDVVEQKGHILKADAINSGAEMTGSSPTTTARYLAKMTSLVGQLAETRGALNEAIIIRTGQQPLETNHKPDPAQVPLPTPEPSSESPGPQSEQERDDMTYRDDPPNEQHEVRPSTIFPGTRRRQPPPATPPPKCSEPGCGGFPAGATGRCTSHQDDQEGVNAE